MIYCNKRKEHVKPEVGQVWRVLNSKNKSSTMSIAYAKYSILAQSYIWGNIIHFNINGKEKNRGGRGRVLHELIKEAPKPPSPWQPIRTVPKDGTKFLIYMPINGKRKIICAWFGNDRDLLTDRFDYQEVIDAGWATHWMPLPEPPESEDA